MQENTFDGGRSSGAKRVALFLPSMGGGGAERVALAVVKDLVAAGHEVDLVLVHGGGELLPLVPPSVNVIDFGLSRLRQAVRPFARYLKRRKPDAVHAVMWPYTTIAILAHRLARSRARLVVSDQVALSQHVRSRAGAAVLRMTTRWLYPRADVRVICSGVAADDLVRLSGLPRNSVEVIFNPVIPPANVPHRPDIDALWGKTQHRILTVGSLKDQKNHALLVRAFAKLRRRMDAKLMILGEGPLRPMLERLIAEEGVEDSVLLPGFSVNPWPYYKSADLFVLSSDYEGFPLVMVEAMQSGLRIVSTDCKSGPREMLDGGRFGFLVPCGDADALAAAMKDALSRPTDAESLRARATALAGQGGIDRYRELMLGEARPAT